MKKQLLFGVAAFAFLASNAQNQAGKKVMMPEKSTLKAYKYEKLRPGTPEVIDDSYKNAQTAATKSKVSKPGSVSKTTAITQNIIGHTWYDLQSNSAVGDRIVVNADGSIAACWTIEPDLGAGDPGTSYANRGTGYNYYDGSNWGAEPTARIESIKTGWGNVVNTGTGKEAIVAHNGTTGLQKSIRNTKGTGAWTSGLAFASPSGGVVTWPRMVGTTTGDTLYNIAAANGTALGQDVPVVFSRSTDGGATWDITNSVPTGLDASKFLGFGGDGYAIAARGPVVAIVAGNVDSDVALVKSTDGGVTWTTDRTVYKFPLSLYNSATTISDIDNDALVDTVLTNDGIYSIALDNNNMAHIFFGRTYMYGDGSQGTFTFYGVDGLCYWNESMADAVANTDPDILSSNAIVVAGVEDLNGNNTIDAGNPATGTGYGAFRGSLTSYPSCAFDAQNNLYLSYSSLNDTLRSYVNTDKNVRHIYVTKRLANAINPDDFCQPIELDEFNSTTLEIFEGMYGSMAKRVDGSVHLVYMRDVAPGHGVPPSSGTNQDQTENHQQSSEIVYAKIPVGDIGNCPLPTGIKNITSSSVLGLNFYPNPASNNATIDVTLNETAKVEIAILNTVGQIVYTTAVNGNVGSNKVDVNLNNLSAGLYFYQVKVGNSKAITQKFAVEK
jgi:hypothetical protein